MDILQESADTVEDGKRLRWSVHPEATVTDLVERADALGISFLLLCDYGYAVEKLTAGELMPPWAQRFEIEDEVILLDGDFGNVNIGTALFYGVNSGATSDTLALHIDRCSVGETTAAELRTLAANLEAAARAIEGTPLPTVTGRTEKYWTISDV